MQPSEFLNMITGETGAGKSIMLGAVGLLMGNRVDTKVLLSQDKKCIVEGIFNIANYRQLKKIFEQEDIDYDEQTIIRREVSPTGKSRAFVNDQPVTLDILRKIGPRLIDVHSQHETLQLGSNLFQLYLIDLFAETHDLKSEYERAYHEHQSLQTKYEELKIMSSNLAKDLDYNSFLLNELSEATLDGVNQADLEDELSTLENAEEIKVNLSEVLAVLDRSEYSSLNMLNSIQGSLNKLSQFSAEFASLKERLDSAIIELKDITNELQNKEDLIEHDPGKIEELQNKLNHIYRLQQKHQVSSIEELINLRQELEQKVGQSNNIEEELANCKSAVDKAHQSVLKSGEKLSEKRQSIFGVLEKKITQLLSEVGINEASISISRDLKAPARDGIDDVNILFSANKGIAPQEIKHVASGGEFSRLMFCLKYLLAHKTKLPTVIFDEIDTGVSGEVALKMVKMMKKMANNHQIISISHLPQFAAQGDAHYYVYKDSSEQRAVSKIKRLEGDERILEIAKMIGGEEPSDTAVVNARELMSN